MARYVDADLVKANLEKASIVTRFVDDVPTYEVTELVSCDLSYHN